MSDAGRIDGRSRRPVVAPERRRPANLPTLSSPAMTQHGVILGTAAYMSPEQAEGRVVDARSDLFSLGFVLYEMATGRRSFSGETTLSMLSSTPKDSPRSAP